jgi:hypothetical protein
MVKFEMNKTLIEMKLDKLKNVPNDIIPATFQYFRNTTPTKTGNARSKTELRGNTIVANYPYAQVLNAGRGWRDGQMRGSIQAPYGMTEPTKQFFMKQLAQHLAQAIINIKG